MIQIISNEGCTRCETFYNKLTDLGLSVKKEDIKDFTEVQDMSNTVLPIFKMGTTYLGYSSLSQLKATEEEQLEYLKDRYEVFSKIQVSHNNLLTAGFKDIISESDTNIMELKLTDNLSLRVSHFDPYFMSGDSIQLYNKKTGNYSSQVLNLK